MAYSLPLLMRMYNLFIKPTGKLYSHLILSFSLNSYIIVNFINSKSIFYRGNSYSLKESNIFCPIEIVSITYSILLLYFVLNIMVEFVIFRCCFIILFISWSTLFFCRKKAYFLRLKIS